MARLTLSVTVGTVLTDGQIAPLIKSMADPVTNITTANNQTSSVLYGLASAQLAGLSTTALAGLVSVQMGGLTTGQTASLAVASSLAGDVTLIYDDSVVTTKNILAKVLDQLKAQALARNTPSS